MRKLLVTISVLLLLGFTVSHVLAKPPSNKPTQPASVCYSFAGYPTDFLVLNIVPGNNIVTGIYRQCVVGASPGTGSADALLVGTIQDVAEGSTIPYGPYISEVLTQMALTGSIASGNFGGDSWDKAGQCWLHMLFEDTEMTTGEIVGACGWFNFQGNQLLDNGDLFNNQINRVSCMEVPVFDGTCSPP